MLLALVATIIVVLASGGDDSSDEAPNGAPTSSQSSPTSTTSSTSTSSAPPSSSHESEGDAADVTKDGTGPNTVILDSKKILGQKVDRVIAGLEDIGYELTVEVVYVEGTQGYGEPDTVYAGEPLDVPIEPEDYITLYAVPESSEAPSS